MVDGEPVFAQPWEGRAYGLALDVIERLGLPWSAFRDRLIEAIAESSDRPYFESWVIALERLATTTGVTVDDLDHQRLASAVYHYAEDGVPIDVIPLAMSNDVLRAVLGYPFGDVAHGQTELFCRAGSQWGVRAFDSSGAVVESHEFEGEAWHALRNELFVTGRGARHDSPQE